jgi:DHA1 family multidrug resistance protein-like MFS transporter
MSPIAATRRWLDRWGPLLPILVAEFVILLGFGALLPVLPLYMVEHGVDVPTLGLILAAWSIAKLVAEPFFGFLADRTSRKPFLVWGAIVLAVATMLPLVFTSVAALFLARAVAGAAAGAYDPAARGIIVDATPEGERGEAFGLYSAFQMGGIVLGPLLGALGAALGGGFAFPFVLTGVLTLVAAAFLVVALPAHPTVLEAYAAPEAPSSAPAVHSPGASLPLPEVPVRSTAAPAHPTAPLEPQFSATTAGIPAPDEGHVPTAPLRDLLNRLFLAAIIIHFGFSLAFGVFEVVWTLFLTSLGASIGWVGLTFALFGLPMMLIAPYAGRLVDRYGSIRFVAVSGLVLMLAGTLYAVSTGYLFPSLVVPMEAASEAFLMPALFALVAVGSPAGRTSTAQGIFGAVGTIGIIVATLMAGSLWERGRAWPFWFFVVGAGINLVIGLAMYRWGPQQQERSGPPSLAEA